MKLDKRDEKADKMKELNTQLISAKIILFQ